MSRNLLPTRCERCPLQSSPVVQGYGPGESPTVVGEAPGTTEVSHKQPFVGQAGRLLRTVLKGVGVDPDETYYTNAVSCHPPGNKTPGIAQVKCCRSRLEQELEIVAPAKILAVGGVALTQVMRSDHTLPITRWHGRGVWTEWGGKRVYTLATYHPAAVLRDSDLFRDFAEDVVKWSEYNSPLPDVCPTIDIPNTATGCLRALQAIETLPDLTIDLETTGPDPVVDRIISVGIGNDQHSVIVGPLLLKTAMVKTGLKRFFTETYGGEFGLWNAKFDIQFLDVYFGEYIRPRAVDAMLEHYLLDERPIGRYKSHGLKAQARIRYDAEDYDFDFTQGVGPERLNALFTYQAKDLAYTSKLKRDLREEMMEESPKLNWVLEELLMPATFALAEIELHGVKIDQAYLRQLQHDTDESMGAKLRSLKELAAHEGMEDFNPLSQPQVSKLIYKQWKLKLPQLTGKRALEQPADTTTKDVLRQLAQTAKNPAIKQGLTDVIEYRLLKKTKETYIDGILERLSPDGRIRSDFRLLGTSTGRLSSADPNLQNIPVLMGDQIKNAFIPSRGCVWVSADYSQLELRVAAAISGDEAMQQVFKTGRDIHTEVASMIFKKQGDQITKQERTMAKHVDFGIIYGRSAASLVDGAELEYKAEDQEWWSVEEAELFLYRFLNGFPKLKLWMEAIKKFALTEKYVETPFGRRRRFPFIGPGEQNGIGRQAVNTPIQSAASDICLAAMVVLHDTLPEGAWVLFSVHDAIYFEIRQEILEPTLQQIYETMVSNTKDYPVPLDVEIEVSQRWGKGEKWHPKSA